MRPDTTAAIRAQLIAAIEQRASRLEGTARVALEARLAALRAHATEAPDEAPHAHACPPFPSQLRALVGLLAHQASSGHDAYPDVPALADFRRLWSNLRADRQLRQSIAHTPADAGPLNSAALASRAIGLMRELSPGYLRSFLAYVDDLAWLEQSARPSPATGIGAPRKRARKPRT